MQLYHRGEDDDAQKEGAGDAVMVGYAADGKGSPITKEDFEYLVGGD